MLSSDRESYSALVDQVVVGPVNISSTDINMVLGVNQEMFNNSKKKRSELIEAGNKPAWLEKDAGKSERIQSLPNIYQPTMRKLSGYRRAKKTRSLGDTGGNSRASGHSLLRSGLERQFEMFSKFGGSETQGSLITLTQSDKWFRQARVIDSWSVTTIDTALAFR